MAVSVAGFACHSAPFTPPRRPSAPPSKQRHWRLKHIAIPILQILTLTLERVFDVQRYDSARYSPRTTRFSFEAGGRNHYGVNVAGWPRLQAGDRLMVVLRSADNWQTLVGWKNLSTGERAMPAASSAWDLVYVLGAAAFLFLVMGSATSPAARQVMFGLRIVLGLALFAALVETWRSHRYRRLIERL